ncbi:MAG TPA: PDZ domain-containing protein, partial [Terriglobales bacterium]|nr:PDZ domain-containing protein [Terriglobales bacterium]
LRAGDVIIRVGDQKISDNSDWSEALRTAKGNKVSVIVIRDKKEQTLTMAVPPRRGPESSALSRDDFRDAEMAIESAAATLDNVGPIVEERIDDGLDSAIDAFSDNQDEIQAVQKAMHQLNRELIDKRNAINRNVGASMKLASAQLKAHSGDIQRAMQEAQRAIEQIHIDCWKSDLQ